MKKALSEMGLEELWRLFPIRLEPWREEWAQWFREEKEELRNILPMEQVWRIEHIGSTAVREIWAKPTVDILVEMKEGQGLDDAGARLENSGYLLMAEASDRRSYNKGYTPEGFAARVFHIHLRQAGDHDELYFRDWLYADRQAAEEYEQLKLRLWKAYEHDRDGYTAAKGEFVRRCTAAGRRAFEGRYEEGERHEIEL